MSTSQRRPLAVFWILAVVAAVVMTAGLRQGVASAFVAAAVPTPVLGALSEDFTLRMPLEPQQPDPTTDVEQTTDSGAARPADSAPVSPPVLADLLDRISVPPRGLATPVEPRVSKAGAVATKAKATRQRARQHVRNQDAPGLRHAPGQRHAPGLAKAPGQPAQGHGQARPRVQPQGHVRGHARSHAPRAHRANGKHKAQQPRPGKARGHGRH